MSNGRETKIDKIWELKLSCNDKKAPATNENIEIYNAWILVTSPVIIALSGLFTLSVP